MFEVQQVFTYEWVTVATVDTRDEAEEIALPLMDDERPDTVRVRPVWWEVQVSSLSGWVPVTDHDTQEEAEADLLKREIAASAGANASGEYRVRRVTGEV